MPRLNVSTNIQNDLALFDGRNPTQEEINQYERISNFIMSEATNEERALVHRWQKGDIIVTDLHRMSHTVKGGFKPEQRKFRGLWSYQYD